MGKQHLVYYAADGKDCRVTRRPGAIANAIQGKSLGLAREQKAIAVNTQILEAQETTTAEKVYNLILSGLRIHTAPVPLDPITLLVNPCGKSKDRELVEITEIVKIVDGSN